MSCKRYWVRWWSRDDMDSGFTEPPFQYWISGARYSEVDENFSDHCHLAWIEAESEEAIESAIAKHFPGYELDWIDPVDMDWRPNDRFPDAEIQKLKELKEGSQEEWRPVPGYPDYEVSSGGRFRRVHAKQAWRRGRIVRQYRRPNRYMTVGLYRDGKQITEGSHRLVCMAFHGPPPDPSWHASHENGIPDDNRPENLTWKPASENLDDKRRHGTHGEGVKHPAATITDEVVVRIFSLRANGMTLKQVAGEVGLHFSHVADILARKSWSHVDIPAELITAAQSMDGRRRSVR